MTQVQFEPATREQTKARFAIVGPAGSGRTRAALTLAASLGGTIGVIDTERRRSSSYADRFDFRRLPMTQYHPETLCNNCAIAAHSGINVLLVDCVSAFWSGFGGVREQVDALKGRTNDGWTQIRPYERSMFNALNAYPGHVIVTLRAKIEWVADADASGRITYRPVGTKPDQRDGIEYEFDHVAYLDPEHRVGFAKSLCPELDRAVFPEFGPEIGETLAKWLSEGTPVQDAMDYYREAAEDGVTPEDLLRLRDDSDRAGLHGAAVIGANGKPTTLITYLRDRAKEVTSG